MARVFITGSSDGLGLMAARLLIDQGHEVVLHGRNEGRVATRSRQQPAPGELSPETSLPSLGQEQLPTRSTGSARFDAVIHNAGIGYRERRVEMEPGVPSVFAVNVLAPYILTALIERPKRLVYLSSGMHRGVRHHREVVPEHRESGQAVRPLVNWRMEDVWLDEYLPRKYKWPKRFDAL